MAENPTFDFASRDFANIRQDLVNRASRAIPEWTDRDPSDFAMALIELWAYVGDILHFYIDRAAQEAFITSATKRESVLSLANLYDYTPRFINPAEGNVTVSNGTSASVTLPAYTKFTGVHNDTLYNFYNDDVVTIQANSSETVGLYEGVLTEKKVLTTSASGQIGQRYTLPLTNVVPNSVRVYVTEGVSEESEWPQVANVNTLPSAIAGFSVYVNPDQTVDVVFGNRASGRIPPVGATISVTYATCSGTSGNVPANTVQAFSQLVSDALSIGASSAFTGGSDLESVDSIKRSIKATIRTQQRAVTLQDFADYASLTTGVYKAVASYSASAGSASVTLHAMPYISNYTEYTDISVAVPASIQAALVDEIQPLATLGVTVFAAPTVGLGKVNISANVYVKPNYVSSYVKSQVENQIDQLLDLNELDFGKEVRIGDVYRAILAVEGVDYTEITSFQIRDAVTDAVISDFASAHPTKFLRKGTVLISNFGGITTS